MSIVFGWNNFRLKSYTPSELGISTERNAPHFTIEARQAYFHLFWIPFFGIGKKWAIRKDHQLYELPPEYVQHIRSRNIRLRTPWYTFAVPLLIVAGILIWQVSGQMNERRSQRNSQAWYDKTLQVLDSSLVHLTDKHFIKVRKVNGPQYDRNVFLKVEAVKGDSVTVTYVDPGLDSYLVLPMQVEAYYLKNREYIIQQQYTMHINELKAAVTRKYVDRSAMQRPGVALLKGDTVRYAVEEADAYFGPILKDRGTGGYGDNYLSMEFTNEGWPAAIIDLKTITGGLEWETALPADFPTVKQSGYPSAHLRAKKYRYGTAYSFTMEIVDTSGTRHKYLVEGVNLEKKITLIK